MTAVLVLLAVTGAGWTILLIAGRTHRPPVLLPATLLPCGCLRIGAGLLLPCAEHDPGAEPPVEQWAAELGQEES